MAYRELLRRWHEAVREADRGHWDAALDTWSSIAEPPARICFNMGCVQLLAGRPEAALRAFNKTIEKDNSLAVGYFQRGFVHLQLEMYEEALSDYHMAFSHLRQNPFIDYKQLGLRHILYAWEVLYSIAAVQCHLQQWQEARVTLEQAVVWRPERRAAVLELALERVQDHLFLEPMLVPLGELFRPRKKEVEQLDSKDFLGKPKVISSIIPNDEYIGFEPLRPQKQGFYEPSAGALRDAESGYQRLLSRYRPREPQGLEVPAGSLVFVLSRAADGWATAIHDGQKLHIPSSLLEPAPRMEKWKNSTGIPLPPAQVPPSCLHVKQKPDAPREQNASASDASAHVDSKMSPRSGEAAAGTARPVVLRLRCECSVVLRAGEAPALPALRALLQDTLAQQAQQGTLSYRLLDGTELGTVSGQEELGKVWQQLIEGRLTLCCQDSDSHSGRPVLYQMLAQHSYLAQGPGDLEFSKGDVLDILSEVNEDWLEGRCNGKTGIFPKCFATQTSCGAAFP
ncbi:NADPH oxidase activator 1 isoform X1 [Poecile atricapillus]|nr:NADPH oxidase activator 1 isoform X1 [Poecile atricapillus]XP_058709681.1 NADPH oxidase activator 1 isoform X1 [Poecile atricapillus]XP_058709682.1 NADPH oxidase activator 1 isoform X1 [Poecile atricapillus]